MREEALGTIKASGSDVLLARFWALEGSWRAFRNEESMAIELLRQGFNPLFQAGDILTTAQSGVYLGSLLFENGSQEEGLLQVERSAPMVEATRDPLRIAYLHEVRGRNALALGEAAQAEASFRLALEAWTLVESDFQVADQLLSLTRALLAQGRYEEARVSLAQSADRWFADHNAGGLCQSLTALAVLQAQAGEPSLAAESLAHSLAFEASGDLALVGTERAFRARTITELGQPLPTAPREPSLAETYALFGWLSDFR
jgi:tetratricopeptide (TPR) repeat protein